MPFSFSQLVSCPASLWIVRSYTAQNRCSVYLHFECLQPQTMGPRSQSLTYSRGTVKEPDSYTHCDGLRLMVFFPPGTAETGKMSRLWVPNTHNQHFAVGLSMENAQFEPTVGVNNEAGLSLYWDWLLCSTGSSDWDSKQMNMNDDLHNIVRRTGVPQKRLDHIIEKQPYFLCLL